MTSITAAVVPTDEQQKIIDHDHRPALVFAVAGAGKTTTMVRRVERLVRERVFRPERILATSFSKTTVEDLEKALSAFPHASKVQVKTLHALGYAILRDAQKRKLGADLKLPEDVEAAPHLILNAALALARSSRAPFLAELDALDREDFFAFVGGLKATLAFTKERLRELPHGTVATEAESPASLPWYGGLYKLFEQARLEQGTLTFDDLVPESWARLVQYPALAERHRGLYDAVLVDEFQDTNLSQVELLDLLVREHKNVMAVGDDDQTIFGFRKASNTFILGFAKRYGAATYRISDNFRCFAKHTILANHVILRNKVRAPKQLAPARGFGGETVITAHDSADEMGAQIAQNIRIAIDSGLRADQVAVLVRLYAETGPVETALLEEGISYRVVGNVPFYDRPENTLLLKYLEVALIERRTTGALSAGDKAQLSDIWWDVLRTPKRYVRRDASDALLRDVLVRGTPPSVALLTAGSLSGYAGPKLVALGQTLSWLVEALDKGTSAYALLLELEARLEYKTFLLENSGFAETGQGKAQNVAAFIDYAKSKGDAATLLAKIDRARALHKGERGAQVVISSIFRAKGLEWPHVIVPAVNYGHLPAAGNDTDLSEERRLFYVALTRTKATLELHVLKNRPPSIFMEGLGSLRTAAEASQAAFSKPLGQWGAAEAVAVADIYRYLDRYVEVWSGMAEADQRELAGWMLAANKAHGMKSTPPLPRELERRLSQVALPDEAKVEACARQLGVLHRLGTQAPPAFTSQQRRPYNFAKDGRLERGVRVWHKLHGGGRVTYAGVEQLGEVVEVTFDKGRTAKFVAVVAGLNILE